MIKFYFIKFIIAAHSFYTGFIVLQDANTL